MDTAQLITNAAQNGSKLRLQLRPPVHTLFNYGGQSTVEGTVASVPRTVYFDMGWTDAFSIRPNGRFPKGLLGDGGLLQIDICDVASITCV